MKNKHTYWLGKKRSVEDRNKMSLARMGKIPWNKGLKRPEITGIRNPFFGKVHSEESLRKMSLGKKGVKNPHTLEQNRKIGESQKGRKFSEEHKLKIKNAHTGKKHPEIQNQNHRIWMITHPNKKYKETGIELKIEEELQKRGVLYNKQVPLCKVAIVDFYLPESKTVIQCDGCYYHNCQLHRPQYNVGVRDKDMKQDILLKASGFKVFRFWEHEINESAEECVNRMGL